MGKALECEACDDDHDGKFDVLGLFSVELCGRCARDLRQALYADGGRLKSAREPLLQQHIAEQISGACIIKNGLVGQDPIENLARLFAFSTVAIQGEFYEAVMAWCANHKTQDQNRREDAFKAASK